MDKTIEEAKNKSIEPDCLGALISSQLLDNDIWIPIKKIEANTKDTILNRFQLVSQSKIEKGSLIGQHFTIVIQALGITSLPKNKSIRGRAPQATTSNLQINSSCLLKIDNPNNSCLFYALEITRKYFTKELGGHWNFNRYMQNKKRQMEDVFDLLRAANIPKDLPEYDAVEYIPTVVDIWNNKYSDSGFKFKIFLFGNDSEKPKFTLEMKISTYLLQFFTKQSF